MRSVAVSLLALALLGGCRGAPSSAESPSSAGERTDPPEPEPAEPEPAEPEPAEPEPKPKPPLCNGQPCAAPRECLGYFGIAGPSGPRFEACEIRCERGTGDNDGCPEGTRCVTIADGPGDVCR